MPKTTEINRLKNPTGALATRMLTALLIMSMTALVLNLVLGTIIPEGWGSNAFWLACITVPLTFIVCGSLYGAAWQCGEREYNLVKHGHLRYDPYKGIKAGVIAAVPGLLFALLAITMVGSANEQADAWGLIAQFLHTCMYTAFYWLDYVTGGEASLSAAALFLPVFAVPILSVAGFYLGYRAVYLRTYIFYNKEEAGKITKNAKPR